MNKFLLYILPLIGCLFLFNSCEEILFEMDISKNEVLLVAPANNAQFFSTGVTFTWENVEEATRYQLQIAKSNFENPIQIVLDTILTNTSYTKQLPIGNYEWRVRAVNSAYTTKYSSRSVSVVNNDNFQDNTIVLNTPINNFTTKTPQQSLTWAPIIGAVNYQVQISDGNNTIVSDQRTSATNLNYSFAEGYYFWRVRATNSTQQTLYSSSSILVDTTAPNTPILSSPANASRTTNNNISFQWNRASILGSVEKDSIYIYTDNALTVLQQKKEANRPFAANLELGSYYWYIKSFDQAGNISERSSIFSFTID